MGRKNSKGSGGHKGMVVHKETKPDQIVYRGPIAVPSNGLVEDSTTVTLQSAGFVAGSSVGLQVQLGTGQVNSANDWSKFSTIYDEYRVLAMQLKYLPSYPGGNASVVHSAGLAVSTHQPSNPFPFTNISIMSDYGSAKAFHTGDKLTLPWRMDGTEEAQWISTSSTPNVSGWVGYWAPYATSTGNYGLQVNSFVVQFRGRV